MRRGLGSGILVIAMALGPASRGDAEPNHPALKSLVPLAEVYAVGTNAPPFDVAGLRCAGLLLAQHDWAAKDATVTGPDGSDMQSADRLLEASEQQRLNDGMDLVAAHRSIEKEARRVWKLYERRFRKNAATGGHPWAGDALLEGDISFCAALAARNPQ